jgi:hypothetical protein
MATEEVIVVLDARTARLDASLARTNASLNNLGETTQRVDTRLGRMSDAASSTAKTLGVAFAAVTALTAGTVALIKQTTLYGKEIRLASQLSGMATDELQSMAFATSTVAIDIEKLGDISKDTREKIGNFTSESKGGFADFATVMKLTTIEATSMAKEFELLSGPDVLQEMVTKMQEAGVSTQEMSFALEGMASDTTNLIPLLLDGGRAMEDLRSAMDGVTVPLTDEDLQKLADLDKALNIAAESAKSLTNQTLVDLSDWFTKAASTAAFFFATLNDGTRAYKTQQLKEVNEDLKVLQESAENADSVWGRLKNSLSGNVFQKQFNTEKQNELLEKQWGLMTEIADIDKGKATIVSNTIVPEVEPVSPANSNIKLTADEIAKRKQAVIDSFKTEQELLTEKYKSDQELFSENKSVLLQLEERYKEDLAELNSDNSLDFIRDRYRSEEELLQQKFERELEMIGEDEELKKERKAQFLEDMAALEQKALDEKTEAEEKASDEIIKNAQKAAKTESKIEEGKARLAGRVAQTLLSGSMSTQEKLFTIVKDSAAGQIEAYGLTAAAKSLAELGPIAGPPVAASQITWSQVAAGVVRALPIGGGGGGGGSPSSTGTDSSPEQAQEAFQPETTSLELSDSTASGSQTLNITVPSGDELGMAVANWMKQAQIEGII